MDTGPFDQYHVEQWGEIAIGVDVPCFLWPETVGGISAPVMMLNITAEARKAGKW